MLFYRVGNGLVGIMAISRQSWGFSLQTIFRTEEVQYLRISLDNGSYFDHSNRIQSINHMTI